MLKQPFSTQYFVASADALTQRPRLLSRVVPDRLLICQSSIDALSTHPTSRRQAKLLERYVAHLVARGAQVLPSNGERPRQWYSRMPRDYRPEVFACKHLIPGGQTKFFVLGTRRTVLAEGEEAKVTLVDWDRIWPSEKSDSETLKIGMEYSLAVNRSRLALLNRFAFSLIAAYIAFLVIWYLINLVLSKSADYNPVAVAAAILVAGVGIFFWRERARLSYGLFEVIVGVAVSYNAFTSSVSVEGQAGPTAVLQFAAGLYAVVRGMDNVGRSLASTAMGSLWQWVFEARTTGTEGQKDAPAVPKTTTEAPK